MNDLRYGMNLSIVPLVSPVDIVAVETVSPFVKLSNSLRCQFNVFFGTITGDSVDITVECCTANSTTGVTNITVPFTYRKSGAVGDDTYGAVTTADSGGFAVSASDDDKIVLIDYDPASNPEYAYARVVLTPGSSCSAVEVAVQAFLEPRYAQFNIPSST
jgi:hypothetical protein